MERPHDAIVLGLGATGASTLYQLARRGARVLGIDRHSPPHDLGSSHGETRITRLAIGEGPHYSPLALRSHEIWREIERATGRSLLTVTGGLVLSSPAPRSQCHVPGFFENTLAAALRHGIDHEVLDAPGVRRRFPAFRVRDDETGYYEPGAGFLRPEACVEAQLALAAQHGATIHRGEAALRFEPEGDAVRLVTERGQYRARHLFLAAGPWLPELLGPALGRHFAVQRQVLFWFEVKGDASRFAPGRFPVFIWQLADDPQPIYGFPAIGGAAGGVKIASEQHEVATSARDVSRDVDPAEARTAYERFVAPNFPDVGPRCVKAASCLYTVTRDFQFVVDAHPAVPAATIVSPCSGHGFKHSAALGEALAQRFLDGCSAIDLGAFSLERLTRSLARP